MTAPVTPLIAGLGPTELLIILAVLVLLFGAAKLPELARGSGRALRIFKAETKGLMDDDDETAATATTATGTSVKSPIVPTGPSELSSDSAKTQHQLELEAWQADLSRRQAELDAETERLHRGDV